MEFYVYYSCLRCYIRIPFNTVTSYGSLYEIRETGTFCILWRTKHPLNTSREERSKKHEGAGRVVWCCLQEQTQRRGQALEDGHHIDPHPRLRHHVDLAPRRRPFSDIPLPLPAPTSPCRFLLVRRVVARCSDMEDERGTSGGR